MSAAIDVQGLRKSFQIPHETRNTLKERFLHPFHRVDHERIEALKGISFTVEHGEFLGVIGPNGSGKSTLLKILSGIYVGDEGVIRVNGRLSPFIELGIGFNDELSGRDNVRVNGVLLGLSPQEIDRRFDEIVAFSGLERYIDQKLKNFSSGMKVRLAYSVAIRVDFDVLLLDEVLAVGDQEFQDQCFATLDEIRAAGKTIVFVSHDLQAVREHCDRVLHLDQGEIVETGPPDEVVDRYLDVVPHRAP